MPTSEADQIITDLAVGIADFNSDLARRAAILRQFTVKIGAYLGDRDCLD
jgi:PIN domain nuclease of toxin-antitoxin system